MRSISKDSAIAFINKKYFKRNNTEVTVYNDKSCLWLHGNCIATKEGEEIRITNCEYFTATTKERLNAILYHVSHGQHKIYQKKGIWYLKNKEWNGSLISI